MHVYDTQSFVRRSANQAVRQGTGMQVSTVLAQNVKDGGEWGQAHQVGVDALDVLREAVRERGLRNLGPPHLAQDVLVLLQPPPLLPHLPSALTLVVKSYLLIVLGACAVCAGQKKSNGDELYQETCLLGSMHWSFTCDDTAWEERGWAVFNSAWQGCGGVTLCCCTAKADKRGRGPQGSGTWTPGQ